VVKTLVLALTVSAAMPLAVRQKEPVRAVPLPPVPAIIAAFRTHSIVALSDGAAHGDVQWHDFLRRLVRDPRFSDTVNDIVVQFGNSRYQEVLDRFIVGEEVPYDLLRQVWQNTTVATALWDTPIYEEFFWTVREMNQSLPKVRQLRVLLGDPPIDWETIRAPRDISRWANARDRHPAEVVQKEVIAKNRRALLVYGAAHLLRKTPPAGGQRGGDVPTLVRLLEHGGTKVFTVVRPGTGETSPLQADLPSWPVPNLVMLRDTLLGGARFRFYSPVPAAFRENDPLRDVLMQDQFDALLLFGATTPIATAELSPAWCADQGYMKMRTSRLMLMTSMIPPGGPNPVEDLKRYCANVSSK
jgi:hypothetical protein